MQYCLVRVSLDSLNIFIIEKKYLIKLYGQNFRFSFCNAHAGLFCENFLLKLDSIGISQFVQIEKQGENWLRCGDFQFNKVIKIQIIYDYKNSID